MKNEARAFAPASIGNVSVGFDCLGLCLEGPGDTVIVRKNNSERGVKISQIENDQGLLPRETKRNVAGLVAEKLLEASDRDCGIDIRIIKGLALKSGMGSSAASSAASAVAVNAALGSPFTKEELLPFVLEGEILAGGSAHADNAAPCLLGGMQLILPGENLKTIALSYPETLSVSLVHPHIEIATREARGILPEEVPMSTAVKQSAYLAAFVHALQICDWSLIAESMRDFLAEPRRKSLMPHLETVRLAAVEAGAVACGISGSGPSIFALCRNIDDARKSAKAMARVYLREGLSCDQYYSHVNSRGTILIS